MNKRWTEKETEELIKLIKEGNSYEYIGEILKRNPNAIRIKAGKIGIFTTQFSEKRYTKLYSCLNCDKKFKGRKYEKRKFCCQSCSGTYNNTHKTHGTRRSKLEKYLEKELIQLYPNLEIHFNRKNAINSELDIYIPSLKLAFELNGIFHYEPIFGEEKLEQIQNNDDRKFQACLQEGIELCIIDSSSLKYFKEQKAKKYLDIICDILEEKDISKANPTNLRNSCQTSITSA